MSKKYISIKWQLTFFIVVLLLLVTGVLSFFILNAQKKSLTNEVKMRGLSIAGNLADNMADFMLTGDELAMARIMSDTMNNKGMKYAFVTDEDSIIRSHNNINMVGKKHMKSGTIKKLVGDTNKVTLRGGEKHGKVLDFTVPVVAKGRLKLGDVHVGISYSVVEEVINRAYRNVIIITAIALVLGIIGAFVLGITLTGPINRLAKGAKIVGTGNLDHKIKVKSKNELGALANIFNMMTRDLKSAQQAVIKQQVMEKELELAKEIQLSLIPSQLPEIKGYETAAFYRAAKEVGGDYYDVLPLAAEKYGVVMGDVSGKGVPAALIMAIARSILRSEAGEKMDSVETVKRLNSLIFNDMKPGMYITLFYGALDTKKNTLDIVSAGHNDTLIYKNKDKAVLSVNPKGFGVGLDPGKRFDKKVKSEAVDIKKGDSIVVYTDE